MQQGYSAAAELARTGDASKAIKFKVLLSSITEDSRRILSLVMRPETSPTMSESTRNILSDFLSKTKVIPLSSKKSLSGESSANLTIDDTSEGKGEKHAAHSKFKGNGLKIKGRGSPTHHKWHASTALLRQDSC
jgi:hypothetical protein